MRLLKKLVLNESLECSKFIQPMCSQVLNGNVRVQASMLEVMSEVIEIVHEEKPIAMKKYVYPMI